MINPPNNIFPAVGTACLFDDEAFNYALLLDDQTSHETALAILSSCPKDPERKQWVTENARELVIRFHLPSLPDWTGIPIDCYRAEYLFSSPEALLSVLKTPPHDPDLIESLKSDRCINEYGETSFHYACKWDNPEKFDLIRRLLVHAQECYREDYEGNFPFDLIDDDNIHGLINILCPTGDLEGQVDLLDENAERIIIKRIMKTTTPLFAQRINQLIRIAEESRSPENRVYVKMLFERLIENDFLKNDQKSVLLFRYPFICQLAIPQSIEDKIHDLLMTSHSFDDFKSPEFISMNSKEKIEYLKIIVSKYDDKTKLRALQTACPLYSCNEDLNRYIISQGFHTASFGNSIFKNENFESVSCWLKSGGRLLDQINNIWWHFPNAYDNALKLVNQSDYFKEYFRKYINPYSGSSFTNSDKLLDLVIATGKPIIQSHFYGYKQGALLKKIFNARGYLLITKKQKLQIKKIAKERESWDNITQATFEELSLTNKCTINRGSITVETTRDDALFYVTASSRKKNHRSIKVTALFNKIGHESLVDKIYKKLLESLKFEESLSTTERTQKSKFSFTGTLPITENYGKFSYVEFVCYYDSNEYYLKFHYRVMPETLSIPESPDLCEYDPKEIFIDTYRKSNEALIHQFHKDLNEIFPESHGNPRAIYLINSDNKKKSDESIEYYLSQQKFEINILSMNNEDRIFMEELSLLPEFKMLEESLIQKRNRLEDELKVMLESYQDASTTYIKGPSTNSTNRKRPALLVHGESSKSRRSGNDFASYGESSDESGGITLILQIEEQIDKINNELQCYRYIIKKAKELGYLYSLNNRTTSLSYTAKGLLLKCKLLNLVAVTPQIELFPLAEAVPFQPPAPSSSSSSSGTSLLPHRVMYAYHLPVTDTTYVSKEFQNLFSIRYNDLNQIESLAYQHPTSPNLALFICARADNTGALTIDEHARMNLLAFTEDYSIRFKRAGSNEEFWIHLQSCHDYSIGNLWIMAHASPEGLIWGENDDEKLTIHNIGYFSDTLKDILAKKLKPGASLFFEACSAGGSTSSGGPNIARRFADLVPGHKVYAPKIDLSKTGSSAPEIQLEQMFPFRCRIMQDGTDQTYCALTEK